MADDEPNLTAGLAAAWGVRARGRPGRKPGLDLDRIVGTASRLADEEGLAAVSMGRVAKELGFTTMSLYRYVSSKDELLQLMFDHVFGPAPEAMPEGWREGLAAWAAALRTGYLAHPWATEIPIAGPPITPNQLLWMDRGLAAMEGTALLPQERPSVILLLAGFVRNLAATVRDLQRTGEFGQNNLEAMQNWGLTVLRLSGGRLPALEKIITGGGFDDEEQPPEELPAFADIEFAFGLERLLDGIEVLIVRRSSQ